MSKNETAPAAFGFLAGLLTILFFAVAIVTGGCAHGASVRHRNPDERVAMTVQLRVFCLLDDPMEIRAILFEGGFGSGLMIDNTHVLTANHVVACPTIPMVTAITADGREYAMSIEKAWMADDVARLVIARKGERFFAGRNGGDVAPPYLALPPLMGEPVCAYVAVPQRGINCGRLIKDTDDHDGDLHIAGLAWRGNSGSGVYDGQGRLVGILVSGYFFRETGEPAGLWQATSIKPEYVFQ